MCVCYYIYNKTAYIHNRLLYVYMCIYIFVYTYMLSYSNIIHSSLKFITLSLQFHVSFPGSPVGFVNCISQNLFFFSTRFTVLLCITHLSIEFLKLETSMLVKTQMNNQKLIFVPPTIIFSQFSLQNLDSMLFCT